MYSEDLMKYLYSYNMPQKPENNEDFGNINHAGKKERVLNTFEKFKHIYATVPVKFNHE